MILINFNFLSYGRISLISQFDIRHYVCEILKIYAMSRNFRLPLKEKKGFQLLHGDKVFSSCDEDVTIVELTIFLEYFGSTFRKIELIS